MAPIRIGMVGLSSSAKSAWAASAHLPYLLANTDKYQIVALCNSSKESAQAAIERYKLDSSLKTYGSPEDLAADPNVDLVVVNTRVDLHAQMAKPTLLGGKNIYVEWPLAGNLQDAEELYRLSKEKGVKSMIGLQSRRSPITLKIKELVDSGRIGRVLSSTITAYSGSKPGNVSEGVKYFVDRKIGGNFVTILYGHIIDYVHAILGEFSEFSSHNSQIRPDISVLDGDGKVVDTVKSDVPDRLAVHGTLKSSNAPFDMVFASGQPFKGTPGLTWQIYGDKGEIRITSPGPTMQFNADKFEIQLQVYEKDLPESITWDQHFADLAPQARDVAGLYEAYYTGKEGSYPDFDLAITRSREIAAVFEGSGKTVEYL